jgi:hypothetical protein
MKITFFPEAEEVVPRFPMFIVAVMDSLAGEDPSEPSWVTLITAIGEPVGVTGALTASSTVIVLYEDPDFISAVDVPLAATVLAAAVNGFETTIVIS